VQGQERMDKFGRLKPEPEQTALKGSKMEGPQDVRLKLFHAMTVVYIPHALLRRPLCMISHGPKPHTLCAVLSLRAGMLRVVLMSEMALRLT